MNLLVVTNEFDVSVAPEALELKAFKALVTRDKGSKGDHDGRKKYRAKAEFAYIWHMTHVDSPYFSQERALRHKNLVKDLFVDEPWKPDELVQEALALYESLVKTTSVRVLETIRDSLIVTDNMTKKLIENISDRITNGEYKKVVLNRVGTPISGVSIIMDDLTQLIKLSNEIPKTIDTMEKMEEKVKK